MYWLGIIMGTVCSSLIWLALYLIKDTPPTKKDNKKTLTKE
jgi:hypothetical protein